jgi:prepilin-type N-terminal cleavage/methylation domain-containing protein/prepilin-type processing-associated H-X9-DG protein
MNYPVSAARACRSQRRAFTLVELLVVIGIIALLISILLPTLSSARRAAGAAKCAAQLREIGNAFQMYANDSKGWFPPAQLQTVSQPSPANLAYNLNGVPYCTNISGRNYNAMWFNFLERYVTKYKSGGAVTNGTEADLQRKTIIWGCPAWEGYYLNNSPGGYSVVQTGYGMNGWPTFTRTNPAVTTAANPLPPASESVFITGWSPTSKDPGAGTGQGRFYKQVVWAKDGAERCLVADCVFWLAESEYVLPPNGITAMGDLTNGGATFFQLGQSTIDVYRHGKYPGHSATPGLFQNTGGKVVYNILYVDGHVAGTNDRVVAYQSMRMRYPN